ncbi:Thioredoxin domain [Arabidopsis thaliana x Arabidopsis arenosa]|uniref:Thioredoxin domain n=1 Tax=Arabidopsis thaliana x Arabidopsis arenosa TaxID=1240361 RepID=A0A8T2BKD3_9BRAS|nr:Thioredoxin domain [Arabidopsis thaliana x Arabidopsis arenosa]
MGANVSSPEQRFQVTHFRSRKPWTPQPEIYPFNVNSPRIVEIKNMNQWKSRLNALNDTNNLLVIEFTAKWCGPCKSLEPKLEELAAKYTDVEFVKIDVDVLMSVWMEYNLNTLPAIVFMKRGREVDRVVGVKVDEVERKLHKYTQSFF